MTALPESGHCPREKVADHAEERPMTTIDAGEAIQLL